MAERSRALVGAQYMLHHTPDLFTFTLKGAPRTKKNHGRIVWRHVAGVQRKFHVPSGAYSLWCASVVIQLVHVRQLPNCHYNCAAVFYRDANRGDAVGYYQGLADALEAAGVISNDKYITQWDDSRLRVDRANPRVELTLTPVEA